MFADHIKCAILALVEIDEGATDAERERVRLALTDARPRGRTIRIAEAAGMLGVHRNTILNWIASGKLVGVKGGGSKWFGVTEQSLAAV